MLKYFKNKKIIVTAGITMLCMLPVASHASLSVPKQIEVPNIGITKIAQLPQTSSIYLGSYQRFNDMQEPSVIEVAPIEDVSAYLPALDELYPQTIDTEGILKLINRRSDTFTIIDIETGLHFDAVRYGGSNHMDTEPKTTTDADILNSINGKSWNRRAIVVYFDGNFYAASMHTMPHGGCHISDNGYNGHICVHVTGSKTHGGGRVCPMHQAMVEISSQTNIAKIVSEIPAISENL